MKTKSFIKLSSILLVLVTILSISFSKKEDDQPMAIMAYYVPSRTYSLDDIPYQKLTHIIFSFTEVIDNKMKFKNKESSQKLKDLVAYGRVLCPSIPVDRETRYFPKVIFEGDISGKSWWSMLAASNTLIIMRLGSDPSRTSRRI